MESFDKDEDESKPVIMTGLKGQILRFGEHNIYHLRKELHAAVDENINMTDSEKDLRKTLLDRVSILVGVQVQKYNVEWPLWTKVNLMSYDMNHIIWLIS